MDKDLRKEAARAVEKNDISTLRKLLESEEELARQALPFTEACRRGNIEAVELLVRFGADVNTIGGSGPKGIPKPLFWTVRSALWTEGHGKVMNFLIDNGADVDGGLEMQEVTPFVAAAERGHAEAVELLLQRGASVGFHESIMLGRLGDVSDALAKEPGLAAHVRLSGVGIHNVCGTPLHFAAISALGNDEKKVAASLSEIADTLIQAGAPVAGGEYDGYIIPEPASAAARTGNSGVLQVILQHGADPNISLAPALESGSTSVLDVLSNYSVEIDAPGDPKLANTLLHEMIRWGKLASARWLVERGANVNSADKDGLTPLHYAARRGSAVEFLGYLIDHGADTSRRSNDGDTPLDIAKQRNRKKIVSYLGD